MRAEKTAWRNLGDVGVIIELGEKRNFHEVNAVGILIWTLCDGERNINDVAARISEEYEIELAAAEQDVEQFLDVLAQKELITWSPNAANGS